MFIRLHLRRRIHGCRPTLTNLPPSNHASVLSLPNPPSPFSAGLPTTALGQPFHLGPWYGRNLFPSSNRSCSRFAGNITSICSKPRQKIQSQPLLFQSCSFTVKSIAAFRCGTPVRTLTTAVPSAPLLQSFEHRVLAWFFRSPSSHVGTVASPVQPSGNRTRRKPARNPSPGFCISCANSVDNPPGYPVGYSSPHFLLNETPRRARGLAEHLREHP